MKHPRVWGELSGGKSCRGRIVQGRTVQGQNVQEAKHPDRGETSWRRNESSRLSNTSSHPFTSGTTALEPMGPTIIKPQVTHANSQTVGGLPLQHISTAPTIPSQQNPQVFTLNNTPYPSHSAPTHNSLSVLTQENLSLVIRVVDYWNRLSGSCVNCSTMNDFKSKIKPELKLEL